MTTIRVGARRRFTQVDRDAVNDSRLSWRARGILVWLLDKPDNWETNSDRISLQGIEGRDAVRSALKELESFGYLTRERHRKTNGTWLIQWTVNEVSTVPMEPHGACGKAPSPGTDFQSPDSPGQTGISAGRRQDGFSGVGRDQPKRTKSAGRRQDGFSGDLIDTEIDTDYAREKVVQNRVAFQRDSARQLGLACSECQGSGVVEIDATTARCCGACSGSGVTRAKSAEA